MAVQDTSYKDPLSKVLPSSSPSVNAQANASLDTWNSTDYLAKRHSVAPPSPLLVQRPLASILTDFGKLARAYVLAIQEHDLRIEIDLIGNESGIDKELPTDLGAFARNTIGNLRLVPDFGVPSRQEFTSSTTTAINSATLAIGSSASARIGAIVIGDSKVDGTLSGTARRSNTSANRYIDVFVRSQPKAGWADAHLHQFSNFAFGSPALESTIEAIAPAGDIDPFTFSGVAGGALFITVGGDPRDPPGPSEDFSAYEAVVLDVRGKNGGERPLWGFKTNGDRDDGLEPRVVIERSLGRGLTQNLELYTILLDSRFDHREIRPDGVSRAISVRDRLKEIYVLTELVFGGTAPQTVDVRLVSFGPARPIPSRVTNAASFSGSAVAPGQIVTVFGTAMGPAEGVGCGLDAQDRIPTTCAGARVLFDGVAAPLYYVRRDQINVQVPYEVGGKASTKMRVFVDDQSLSELTVPVDVSAPGVFVLSEGRAAALNQDGSINSPQNRASRSDLVILFATGEGQTNDEAWKSQYEGPQGAYWGVLDGRVRNSYQGGDLALPATWSPLNDIGTVRLAGFSVDSQLGANRRAYIWHCHILAHEENNMMLAPLAHNRSVPVCLGTAERLDNGRGARVVAIAWFVVADSSSRLLTSAGRSALNVEVLHNGGADLQVRTSPADVNGDGMVDIRDFDVVRSRLGNRPLVETTVLNSGGAKLSVRTTVR